MRTFGCKSGPSLAAVLVAAMVILAGLTTSPAVAQTTICSGVSVQEVQRCDSGWAANMHFMHWRMYSGHNCTNYVAYRLKRDGVPEPSYRLGNADTWAPNARSHGVRVDGTPEVGAVGAWPGRRHIVYVEEIGSNYLITSEDNWPGYYPRGMYRKIKVYKGESAYPTQFIHFKGTSTINGPLPSVTGTPKVGSTLTATAGTWSPSDVTLRYQWLRDGVIITGATRTSYTLTSDDVGHAMTISVTGSKSGFASRTASSAPTGPVTAGALTSATPTISGTPRVGSALTAEPGSWGPGAVTFTYQWLADGTAIGGAANKTFVPTDAELGKRISVKVTGRMTGVDSVTAESARTAVVARRGVNPPATVRSSIPTVTGEAKRGRYLTGSPGAWGPDGVALTYEWLRGDVVVASGSTRYKVRNTDLGHRLTFRVTGSKRSLTTVSETSAPTATVRATSTLLISTETGRGTAVLGVVVSVSNAPTPTGYVTVYEGTRRLLRNNLAVGRPGRATLRLTLPRGTHTLRVSYGGSGLVAPGTGTVTVRVS
ncbi:MAG: CHAP domain-containing protein [Aeromicrobium sp.]